MLWYLAGNSLTPYLQQYIERVNNIYPNTVFTLNHVETNHAQGLATLDYIRVELTSTNEKVQAPALELRNITIEYDPKTFKKEAVIINKITIDDVSFFVQKTQSTADMVALQNEISAILSTTLNNAEATLGILDSNEPVVIIEKVTLTNLHITLYDNDIPLQEQIYRNVSVTPSQDSQAVSLALLHAYASIIETSITLFQKEEL